MGQAGAKYQAPGTHRIKASHCRPLPSKLARSLPAASRQLPAGVLFAAPLPAVKLPPVLFSLWHHHQTQYSDTSSRNPLNDNAHTHRPTKSYKRKINNSYCRQQPPMPSMPEAALAAGQPNKKKKDQKKKRDAQHPPTAALRPYQPGLPGFRP